MRKEGQQRGKTEVRSQIVILGFGTHDIDMNIAPAQISYQFAISVPAERLRSCALLFDQKLDQCEGIDTKNLKRAYPDTSRKLPSKWLEEHERKCPFGPGPVLVQSWRNLIQNKGCPAWSKMFGVCQSASEHVERHKRPYRGVSFVSNGLLRADEFYLSKPLPDDVEQFGTGIPVLWHGHLLTMKELAPDIADFSHLWRMETSSSRSSTEDELKRFERFQAVFERVRHEDWEQAGEAMLEESRGSELGGLPLDRERTYLHNLVGVREDGGLVILVATGSLEELGEQALLAGAVSAIIVDNGGSCQVALRNSPAGELRPLIESYYHRPLSIAVAVYELRQDAGFPIIGGSLSHSPIGRKRFTVSNEVPAALPLTFQTDYGLVERRFPLHRRNLAAADRVAVAIANFAVIHGASGVSIGAEESFVQHVKSCFEQRFRAVKRSDDPTGIQGMWLEDYLKGVYDRPFTMIRAGSAPLDNVTQVDRELHKLPTPAEYTLGIDIGASNIRCVILKDGCTALASSLVPTRISGVAYTSAVLQCQLWAATQAVCEKAGIAQTQIDAVGLSWPGAVRNSRAAPSKTLMNMQDVLNGTDFNEKRFEEIRDLGPWVKRSLKLESLPIILVFNDGEVEVLHNILQTGIENALLVKLGTTVAGAYVDAQGRTGYLTELGRVVIRLDSSAPRHPFSKIRGLASQLIGSNALARIAGEIGIETVDGRSISSHDAGRELGEVIHTGGKAGSLVAGILDDMGLQLAYLIREAVGHLPPVEHILLRGGPMNGEVGARLRESLMRHLPEALSQRVSNDQTPQESGATAAAFIAATHNS